jgi:hypothetical protein
VACFSSLKDDRQLTGVSPAVHHTFTSEKPRSAPRFCQNPQQKGRFSSPEKIPHFVPRRGLGQVGFEPLVGGIAAYACFSEAAIAFELRLGEPLVGGGVVGEGVVLLVVVDEVGGEAVGEGRFDVEDLTSLSAGVVNGSHDAVTGTDRRRTGGFEL